MPPDVSVLPYEVQVAFLLHSNLNDNWDGMSGYYMGKDYTPIETLFNVYNIEDRKTVWFFLKWIEHYSSEAINKKVKERQDAESRKAKAQSSVRKK